MPQSLANVLLHIVFSTKNREPFLKTPELRSALNGYMVGTLQNIKCPSLIVNCVEDHIHVLCQLARTVTIAELIEEMKVSSSKWMKESPRDVLTFQWQAGYGAFSVSQSMRDVVRGYIARQEEHHRKHSFQDEFRELLRRHQIEWDEKYVWD